MLVNVTDFQELSDREFGEYAMQKLARLLPTTSLPVEYEIMIKRVRNIRHFDVDAAISKSDDMINKNDKKVNKQEWESIKCLLMKMKSCQ